MADVQELEPKTGDLTGTKPAAPKPEPPEELGKELLDFVDRSLRITGRKKEAEPDPQKPKPKPAPPAPKRQKPAPPVAAGIDEDKLGEAVGRSVAQVMDERDARALRKTKQDEAPLPDDIKGDVDKLALLERQFPEKYKGYVEKYKSNLKKLADYADKWEEEHPGENFDEDADEHADFRSQLEADTEYDEDDHVAALANEIADRKVARVKADVETQLQPIKRREMMQAKQGEIITTRDRAGNSYWDNMGDEFKGVLDEQGNVVPQKLDEIRTKDPVIHDIVVNGAAFVENMAAETFMLDNELVEFMGDKPITGSTPPQVAQQIQAHAFLSRFASDAEQRMASRPAEKQMDAEGRTFLPRTKYNSLPVRQREKYWTFTYDDLGFLLAEHVAKRTRKQLADEEEKFTAIARSRGLIPQAQSLPNKSRAGAPQAGARPSQPQAKPLSPSTPLAPRLAPARANQGAPSGNALEGFVSRAIRGV